MEVVLARGRPCAALPYGDGHMFCVLWLLGVVFLLRSGVDLAKVITV